MGMTNEEAVEVLKQDILCEHDNDLIEALNMAIKALEQEPCEDEYIKVPKKALKYRTAGMVAYNAEWLKNNFDIERAVICGTQEPCEDAISREDALMALTGEWTEPTDELIYRFIKRIKKLPPVTPQPKTGHWIANKAKYYPGWIHCSECGEDWTHDGRPPYCPACGARMVESDDKG